MSSDRLVDWKSFFVLTLPHRQYTGHRLYSRTSCVSLGKRLSFRSERKETKIPKSVLQEFSKQIPKYIPRYIHLYKIRSTWSQIGSSIITEADIDVQTEVHLYKKDIETVRWNIVLVLDEFKSGKNRNYFFKSYILFLNLLFFLDTCSSDYTMVVTDTHNLSKLEWNEVIPPSDRFRWDHLWYIVENVSYNG